MATILYQPIIKTIHKDVNTTNSTCKECNAKLTVSVLENITKEQADSKITYQGAKYCR